MSTSISNLLNCPFLSAKLFGTSVQQYAESFTHEQILDQFCQNISLPRQEILDSISELKSLLDQHTEIKSQTVRVMREYHDIVFREKKLGDDFGLTKEECEKVSGEFHQTQEELAKKISEREKLTKSIDSISSALKTAKSTKKMSLKRAKAEQTTQKQALNVQIETLTKNKNELERASDQLKMSVQLLSRSLLDPIQDFIKQKLTKQLTFFCNQGIQVSDRIKEIIKRFDDRVIPFAEMPTVSFKGVDEVLLELASLHHKPE